MEENLTELNDYDGLTRGKLCPLKQGIGIDHWRECDGPAAPGMTKRRSAARCSLWPGTNDNTPAYS